MWWGVLPHQSAAGQEMKCRPRTVRPLCRRRASRVCALQAVSASPEALAEIGAIVGASTEDVKQEMVAYFEAFAQTLTGAIEAATNRGPHR